MPTTPWRRVGTAALGALLALGLAGSSAWALDADDDAPTSAQRAEQLTGIVSPSDDSELPLTSMKFRVGDVCLAPELITPDTSLGVSTARRQVPPVTCNTDGGTFESAIINGQLCVTITPNEERPTIVKINVTDANGNGVNLVGGKYCLNLVGGKATINIKGEIDYTRFAPNLALTVQVVWTGTKWVNTISVKAK